MTAVKEQPKIKQREYIPVPVPETVPHGASPYVGMGILWYPNGIENEPSLGAIVTNVGISGIVSAKIFEDGTLFVFKDGIMHLEDPAVPLRREQRGKYEFSGCWDYTPETKALMLLMPSSPHENGIKQYVESLARDVMRLTEENKKFKEIVEALAKKIQAISTVPPGTAAPK